MQFHSFFSTLNARMYLYDTPRDTMAKDLMLQSLCSTSTWKDSGLMPNTSKLSFHVFQSFMLNTNIILMCYRDSRSTETSITHVLQSPSLNTKHQLLMCSRAPYSTQNISSIMCFRVHPQQNKHIYMINNWLTP